MKNKFFQADNPFNVIMTKIFDLFLLNVIWVICCIPVVTIGAATQGLYTVTLKMAKDRESGIFTQFLQGFLSGIWKNVAITVIVEAVAGVLIFDLHLLSGKTGGMQGIMYGGCIALMILIGAVLSYVFPLGARFENTLKNTVNNAARIAATHLPQTVLILVVNVMPVVWLLLSPETFSLVFWFWMVFGVAFFALINSFILNRIFDKFVDAETEPEDFIQ